MKRTGLLLVTLHLILYSFFWLGEIYGQTAQQNPYTQESFADRLMFGGIVGFQFGSITYIEVSPIIGYRLSKNFVPGAGFTYQYSRFKDYYINTENGETLDQKINIIGGRAFARYYLNDVLNGIFGGLFAHAEFEYLSYTRHYRIDPAGKYVDRYYGKRYSDGHETVGVPGLLVGGGLKQSIGGRAFADILILYNLNQTKDTPYSNPIIRIGFGVGL
jgi:hypothetical protein